MHCRFHLPGARGDCSEPNADPPAEKDRANFCDWFSLDPRYRSASAGQKKKADASAAARSAFEDLFK
jgi:hypothetical protein